MDFATIDRSVKRRIKLSTRGTVTVHRTGELPQPKPVDPPKVALVVKDKRSGRVVIGANDLQRFYSTGGVRKKLVATATILEEGEWVETASPKPGSEIVNGLSDTMDRPRRVQRRAKKSKGGRKGARGVLR